MRRHGVPGGGGTCPRDVRLPGLACWPMQATRAARPERDVDDQDLRPIPLGAGSGRSREPAAPPAWEPVAAVARALDRLQRPTHTLEQEVTPHARADRGADP